MKRIELIPSGTYGAEIGVLSGAFSSQIVAKGVAGLLLVDAWRQREGVYAKDPANYADHEANYRAVTDMFGGRNDILIWRMESEDAAKKCNPGSLDWVYIDADHSYEGCYADLANWSRIVTPEKHGRLFLHDYVENDTTKAYGFDVVRAVHDFCEATEWRIEHVTDEEWPTVSLLRLPA